MEKILKQKYIASEDILMEPNDILKEKSEIVKLPLSKEDRNILRIMYNHIVDSQDEEYAEKYNVRAAVGIAAIQIGVKKRMLAIKTIDEENKPVKFMLVNPEYIEKSNEISYLKGGEGCLSVEEDKYQGLVPRYYRVKIKAFNALTNKNEIIELQGYTAIVLQHEMDHLDGILYIDKINKLDANLVKEDWIAV